MDSDRFSWRRLHALCIKEIRQILRDPSTGLVAVVIPLMLLAIFSYGINLDSNRLKLGILVEQRSKDANDLIQAFTSTPYITPFLSISRPELTEMMQAGHISGMVVIPADLSKRLAHPDERAPLQVITDGSDPNTANFVQGYVQSIWQIWQLQQSNDQGRNDRPLIEPKIRYWYNPAANSQYFIVPGAITIIMTVIGAILTSLVIAREWERGTMEALLSTQITPAEFLLSKLIPYYLLGLSVMGLCMLTSTLILGIPFRGSYLLLLLTSSLFMLSSLGLGMLISTVTRLQFNAALISMNAAFLPAVMLSGFIFPIDSMPVLVRAVTYIIPAHFFVSAMQTLFLAGNIGVVLVTNLLFLVSSATILLWLTANKTLRRLD
jgi:ABC-2 type transport system permease protein